MTGQAFGIDERLSAEQFNWLSQFFEARTGIHLAQDKDVLVRGRLLSRARALGLERLSDYLAVLQGPGGANEQGCVVDALTTHETSFFREPKHFEVLAWHALQPRPPGPYRVWSAACSTGEEAASVAMTLAELPRAVTFEVVGTDISAEAVRVASAGLFPMERASQIGSARLKQHCLRGTEEFDGKFRLVPSLASRLSFLVENLLELPSTLGRFDAIFLRNVLIYFDEHRKRRIVRSAVEHLAPGGLLLPGHAENVRDCVDGLTQVGVAAFRLGAAR